MKKTFYLILLFIGLGVFAQAQMSILLVNDNGYAPERVEVIKTAITNAGYSYGFWDASVEMAGPSYEFMSAFNLVIWYTGNDGSGLYFWNGDDTENQAIKDYIDNGGMFWVQGLDFLHDAYPTTPVTYLEGEFVYDYLGIAEYFGQSHVDDQVSFDGVPQLDLVDGNGIFTLDPILWTYETMWWVDALTPTADAQALYQMGPVPIYDLWEYYSAIYHEKGDGKVMTMTFETARIDTQENTDFLFGEALTYFEQFATPGIPVTSIEITSEGGATTIEDNFGTLQLNATVLPDSASIPFVSWSIENSDVIASIDQNGLLQASGTDNGNGTVTVKAESLDGSGVFDTFDVEVSGQGAEFTVLLVNDNANGTDRYLVLDTTLSDLGYVYNVYNTVTTGDFPDEATLSGYDAVIWYTGNDGVDLYLWDVSDTLPGAVNQNLRFNAPLMSYINNGGIVWLQGLDFIYDIYKEAFDVFEPGDFMYDFMGVSAYVGQSYADDGNLGLPQLDVVPGNPICNFTPMLWTYPTLYYADALEITDDAEGIYKMGPSSYQFSNYYAGLFTHPGEGHLFTLTVETARIDTRANTETFYGQVLSYFETLVPDATTEYNQVVNSFNSFPNPVSDQSKLSWELENASDVSLQIYSITGQMVFSNNFGVQSAGTHQFSFSANDLGLQNGLYTVQLTTGKQTTNRKLIIQD